MSCWGDELLVDELSVKHITIVNDNSCVINKFEASLTDDARVTIYDRHMFIVQALVNWINIVKTPYISENLYIYQHFIFEQVIVAGLKPLTLG